MADMSLTPAFNYYLVSHTLWGTATGQISDSATRKLHYVPDGQSVYSTAGKAGDWLGKHQKSLTRRLEVGYTLFSSRAQPALASRFLAAMRQPMTFRKSASTKEVR